MRGRHVRPRTGPPVRSTPGPRTDPKESPVIHTSLYALYAGAATLAATTGGSLTHATGGAVAAYLACRITWDRRHHRALRPAPTPAA